MICSEVKINADQELVWWAWLRSERIIQWFAPQANIVPHKGGAFELFFDPAHPDKMNTKGCTFLSLTPYESFEFTWKGPDDFASLMNQEDSLTRVKVSLGKEGEQTVITVAHIGWGAGEEWEKAKQWHQMAWDFSLASLKKALETGKGELCCQPS